MDVDSVAAGGQAQRGNGLAVAFDRPARGRGWRAESSACRYLRTIPRCVRGRSGALAVPARTACNDRRFAFCRRLQEGARRRCDHGGVAEPDRGRPQQHGRFRLIAGPRRRRCGRCRFGYARRRRGGCGRRCWAALPGATAGPGRPPAGWQRCRRGGVSNPGRAAGCATATTGRPVQGCSTGQVHGYRAAFRCATSCKPIVMPSGVRRAPKSIRRRATRRACGQGRQAVGSSIAGASAGPVPNQVALPFCA